MTSAFGFIVITVIVNRLVLTD